MNAAPFRPLRLCAAVAALLLTALVVPVAASAARSGIAPADRDVAIGAHIDWSFERDRSPARYRSGPVMLTFTGRADPQSPELVQPRLRVEMPGLAPVEVAGSETPPSFDHRATVGRWDADRLYVLFQSYTGGAHCCNAMELVLPEGGQLRVISLGEWDGGPQDDLPTDRDGDGRLDFVFVDNRFLYTFASYAESFAPPMIMNVEDGALVDVSDRPGFRPLFEQAMTQARQACVDPAQGGRFEGMSPNGACAAYVASAARVGRLDEAWTEMLRSYDRNFEWPLPTGCRAVGADGQCPEAERIEYRDYPDALRHFLSESGYFPRQ